MLVVFHSFPGKCRAPNIFFLFDFIFNFIYYLIFCFIFYLFTLFLFSCSDACKSLVLAVVGKLIKTGDKKVQN